MKQTTFSPDVVQNALNKTENSEQLKENLNTLLATFSSFDFERLSVRFLEKAFEGIIYHPDITEKERADLFKDYKALGWLLESLEDFQQNHPNEIRVKSIEATSANPNWRQELGISESAILSLSPIQD